MHDCIVSRVEEGQRLFVYSRYNKAGKELSAVSISHWICTTIGDSHTTVRTARLSQKRSKLMRSVLWQLHYNLFQQVDLQADMKAGRWSSGGTITSFYLLDLCPEADSIRKTGTVIAAGEIVEISSWVNLF